jgi:hypothetical protein
LKKRKFVRLILDKFMRNKFIKQITVLKTKISLSVFLALSLPSFACVSIAASSANVAAAQKQLGESNSSAAEPNTVAVVQKDSGEVKFKGTIGAAKFKMTVARASDDLSGSYFYVKSGSGAELVLSGKIEADGKFTLRETDTGGKQTGEFKGVWQEDANLPGISIAGKWSAPSAAEGVTFFAEEEMISLTGGARIIDKKISSQVKAIGLEAEAEFPQLIGIGANAAGFNRTVKALAEKSVNDFKRLMIKETTGEDLKQLTADSGYYTDLGYSVQYADDDVISLLFVEDSFSGGAHPNHNFFALVYDLKNGRELKLADLFKRSAKYLDTISAYCIKDLQSRKSPETGENSGLAQDIWLDGALPKTDNYKSWNITRKGLVFTFDPYQVGSYVDGPQFVSVPYANLKIIAKPNGALAKFIK